jgi:DNA end-binding protein Ku
MARALWTGAISFGLVNIPVELYPAEDRKTFKFAMLDKRDFSPVGYRRYSKASGKEVDWANIVKGYEYEKDQYVVLSDEDFRQANVKATQTIDIRAFVGDHDVGPEYFDTPYYLVPGKRGEKVYALLRETLKSTKRVAIAELVIRTSQHLAMVIPDDRLLMLVTLRYQDELRPPTSVEAPPATLKAAGATTKEVALAKRLVDDMTEKWNPAEFRDSYHADLMRLIDRKIKLGQTREITAEEKGSPKAPRSAQIIDLADLLKQSLGKRSGEAKPATRSTKAPAATVALRSVKVTAKPKTRAASSTAKPAAPVARRTAAKRKRA